jgi:hypothetical protein
LPATGRALRGIARRRAARADTTLGEQCQFLLNMRREEETAMGLSSVFAHVVARVGDAAILWRRLQGSAQQQAVGSAPVIPMAKAASRR